MKDIITRSFIAGTVIFIYKNIFNHLLVYVGFTDFLYREAAANLTLPLDQAHTFYGAIIGLITDYIGLTWVALVIAYVLKITGKDYYPAKGAFIGATSWLIVYGFIIHSSFVDDIKGTDALSTLVSFFFDVSIGLISSFILVYLERKALSARGER